ncbi:hypothetical protein COU74_00775 [Candidatus Peregrinibacteria bacterium CG10_big_fil_rev_8_21_14_0_10_36_19]|nr:MAG: hypothetical protein COU74_00775 [Candidatus Peregrinibacteria bacterium CG10_big_fil_rev_8_21_14_0_10_36_19]
MTFIKALDENLFKLAKKYSNFVVITTDLASHACNDMFAKFFSNRRINLGLAEMNAASCAVGFNVRGKVPIVVGPAEFLAARAWEQMKYDICIPNLNVKFVGVGYDGTDDVELMKLLPNMKVVCPRTEEEVVIAIENMFLHYGPMYLRLTDALLPDIDDEKLLRRQASVL